VYEGEDYSKILRHSGVRILRPLYYTAYREVFSLAKFSVAGVTCTALRLINMDWWNNSDMRKPTYSKESLSQCHSTTETLH
jgi:hypothetical protein